MSEDQSENRAWAVFDALPVTLSFKWRRAIEELVVTERVYVRELKSIMLGYIHVIPENVSRI